MGLEVFHYGVFEFLAAKATVKDCTVGGKNDDFGNASDGIGIAAGLLRVEHLWIWNLKFCNGFLSVFGVVPSGNAEHQHLVAILLVYVD